MLKRANSPLYMLKVLKKFGLPTANLITVYIGYVRPVAEYAAPVWHPGLNDEQSASLERIQNRAFRIVFGSNFTSYDDALKLCNIPTLQSRRISLCHTFASSLYYSNQFRQWLPATRGINTIGILGIQIDFILPLNGSQNGILTVQFRFMFNC